MRRLLYLIGFVLLLTACGSKPKKSSIPTIPTPIPTVELLIAPKMQPTSTKWISPMSATLKAHYEPTITAAAMEPPNKVIHIDGETIGLYGRRDAWNIGIDGEIAFIAYYIPSGNYRAVNNRSYRDQINVYSSETVWDNGYEYAADGKSYLIEPGGSTDFYVPLGYYVKVAPPTDIDLTHINQYSAAIVSTPESGYHEPQNIYSPTPGPRNYLGSVSSSSGSSCVIKGNPDSMIYHCLNSPNYSTVSGAVYFCSPAEAEAAGYRASRNMSGCQY